MQNRSVAAAAITIVLILIIGFFFAHKINLVTADLGRHIKNGELFFQTWKPVATNFYSYTEPDFPVLNHHWLSGALFFLIWKIAGFGGVQLLFIALNIAAFLICFDIARRRIGTGLAALIALPVIFLLAERTEVRPEAFSYLFAAVFLWVVFSVREGTLPRRWLWALPLVEIAWVNSHIFFFLGPAIIGAFWVEAIIAQRRRHLLKPFTLALVGTALASLVNPFGPAGAIAPFTIFQNYGYRIAENQSVWFIARIAPRPSIYIFAFVFALLCVALILFFIKRKRGAIEDASYFFLAAGFSVLAWLQIRNFLIFGLFALPLIALYVHKAFPAAIRALAATYRELLRQFVLIILLLAGLFLISSDLSRFVPYWRVFGLGLEAGNSRAAEFFKDKNIVGPIFNNYDIGGYLIFHLFPRERVFVDNRPEAYRAEFFQNIYVPAQEKKEAWAALDAKHRFNAIVFAYRDATPWGQHFLIERVRDPLWAPVFVDGSVIIFVKRSEKNAALIRAHELPQDMFTVNASR